MGIGFFRGNCHGAVVRRANSTVGFLPSSEPAGRARTGRGAADTKTGLGHLVRHQPFCDLIWIESGHVFKAVVWDLPALRLCVDILRRRSDRASFVAILAYPTVVEHCDGTKRLLAIASDSRYFEGHLTGFGLLPYSAKPCPW